MPPKRQDFPDDVRRRREFQRNRKTAPRIIKSLPPPPEVHAPDKLFASHCEDPAEVLKKGIDHSTSHDSLDDVSLVLLTYDNVRMKTDENGVICGVHEKQLDEKWKPAELDLDDSERHHNTIPPSGRSLPAPTSSNPIRQSQKKLSDDRLPFFSYTPIRGNQMSSLGNAARFSTSSPFSPKIQNASTPIEKQGKGRTAERMPVFNFSDVLESSERDLERQTTGIAQIQIDVAVDQTAQTNEAEAATVRNSTLKDASAKEKTGDGSRVDDPEKQDQRAESKKTSTKSIRCEKESNKSTQQKNKTSGDASYAVPIDRVKARTVAEAISSRKADISMTEMLQESSEMPNDDTYSKKRQRTKSPETMCQGTSTMMAMSMQENEEKKNGGRRRGTLQPQTQQLLRESRLSTMTTASSRRASIDSLLEEMTIALPDDDDDELCSVRSAEKVRNAESPNSTVAMDNDDKTLLGDSVDRNQSAKLKDSGFEGEGVLPAQKNYPIITISDDDDVEVEDVADSETGKKQAAMTILTDDPDKEPYYFADMSFSLERNAMNALLYNAGQTKPRAWTTVPKGSMDGRTLKKLGEGSYGEVYSTKWDGVPVAIKVVPFEESEDTRKYTGDYNGGAMPTADTILPELLIMKELSSLHDLSLFNASENFINLLSAKVLKGPYPKGLLKAWNTFDEQGEGSMNTRPDEYATKDQLFMLFVTENGGVALENFKLKSENEISSIIMQLMMTLTVAEKALNFEHRDLHLGNVLIDRTSEEYLYFNLGARTFSVATRGVKVNIIDFTLSHIYKDGCAVFMDLEQDPALFEGKGDPQFDVYRKMREVTGGVWKNFFPKTNLIWVQFLAIQMLENKAICPRMSGERKLELRGYFDNFSTFDSCFEFLLTSNQTAILRE